MTGDKAKDAPVLDSLGSLPEYLQPIVYGLLESELSESYSEFADTGDDLMATSFQHLSKVNQLYLEFPF